MINLVKVALPCSVAHDKYDRGIKNVVSGILQLQNTMDYEAV